MQRLSWQSQAVARGGHAALKKAQGPCLSCHSPHDAARPDLLKPCSRQRRRSCGLRAMSCRGRVRRAPPQANPGWDHPSLTCELPDVHDPSETPSCASCHAEPAAAGGYGQGPARPSLTCHPPTQRAGPRQRTRAIPAMRPACLAMRRGASAGAHRGGVDPPPTPCLRRIWAVVCPLGLAPFDATGQPAAVRGTLTCASCHATHGQRPTGRPPAPPGLEGRLLRLPWARRLAALPQLPPSGGPAMTPTLRTLILALSAFAIGFVLVAGLGASLRFLYVAWQHGGLWCFKVFDNSSSAASPTLRPAPSYGWCHRRAGAGLRRPSGTTSSPICGPMTASATTAMCTTMPTRPSPARPVGMTTCHDCLVPIRHYPETSG